MDLLKEKGDKLELARDVHHWAYFKNQNDRKSSRDAIQVLGYRIKSDNENSNSEPCFGICLTKRQEMTPEAVDDAVIQLFRASRSAHGEYDGWESQLIVGAKPPYKKSWWKWR
jgi:regulator of RNase E activity RraB